MSDSDSSINGLDKTIHEPTRLRIMTLLSAERVLSADYVFIHKHLKLTWGNLSSHLKILEKNELIAIEKKFKNRKPQTRVFLTKKGIEAYNNYRNYMKIVLRI